MSKTETPKTENASSTNTASTPTPNNPFAQFASFDPTAAFAASQQAFTKMVSEAHERAQQLAAEYATLEKQLMERAKLAIDSWAKLANDALAYSAQLSAQARQLGLEAVKKVGGAAERA